MKERFSFFSFDEVGEILDNIANELPKDFYRKLNGGVNLLPGTKLHPESNAALGNLFILGEYRNDPRGLGRYINIYYGSFMRLYSHLGYEQLREELRKTLLHEFTHHMESLGGERDLEIKDAQRLIRYKQKNS